MMSDHVTKGKTADRIEKEFLQAYDDYADAIFRYCYFHTFNRDQGKDLMQEVFMRMWLYLHKGNTVKNMRAFLYRIANNLIIDESKKRREVSLEKLQEAGFDPGKDETQRMQDRVEHKRVLTHMERLDNMYRQLIILRYINGFSPSEIAEITGETANTVSVRIHRGLQRLRASLVAP